MPSCSGNRLAEILFKELSQLDPDVADRFDQLFSSSRYASRQAGELENLNSFWREQLESLDVDTIEERDYLCYSEQFSVWLNHFKQYVLPTVFNYNLPRRL